MFYLGPKPTANYLYRTIYVPLENAINVPESYELNVGTSFGYKVREFHCSKWSNITVLRHAIHVVLEL
jgi:hypothetical protein